MTLYRVEGINIYSGKVDWSGTVEASDAPTACMAARVVCVGVLGADKAGVVDLKAFETDIPESIFTPQ